MMAQVRDERSLGDLFSDLSRETTTLVRQEVQLAKAELTQSATEAARGIGMLLGEERSPMPGSSSCCWRSSLG